MIIPVIVIGRRHHMVAVEKYRIQVTGRGDPIREALSTVQQQASRGGFEPGFLALDPIEAILPLERLRNATESPDWTRAVEQLSAGYVRNRRIAEGMW